MKLKLPSLISIFPLSGVIFFPETNLPLNIFEPKYLALVNDCMKSNKYMGIIQSKKIARMSIPSAVLERSLKIKKLEMAEC